MYVTALQRALDTVPDLQRLRGCLRRRFCKVPFRGRKVLYSEKAMDLPTVCAVW